MITFLFYGIVVVIIITTLKQKSYENGNEN